MLPKTYNFYFIVKLLNILYLHKLSDIHTIKFSQVDLD